MQLGYEGQISVEIHHFSAITRKILGIRKKNSELSFVYLVELHHIHLNLTLKIVLYAYQMVKTIENRRF